MDSNDVRAEVRDWIEQNWDLEVTLREWWDRLARAGYAFPTWPLGLGGRGMSGNEARIVTQELAAAKVVGAPSGIGQTMGAPTILDHGTIEQQQRFVLGVANGQESWCQLFSEPGAGSDLASLQTRAVRDGDEFVVTGQKVWNSSAHIADRGLLLARTNLDVAKHAGITYFLIDMDQPGVDVRPLRQMNGAAEFSEVFLDEARVGVDRVIGEVDGGWTVAITTLAHERAGISQGTARGLIPAVPGTRARMLERTVAEVVEAHGDRDRPAVSGFAMSPRFLIGLARDRNLGIDPVLRQRLARYYCMAEVHRLNGLRARGSASRGQGPGPSASTAKLAFAELARTSRDLGLSILGPSGMLAGHDAPLDGAVQNVALSSFAASLGGGTDEIQRNTIGERVLGLPKEPQVDRDVAFRDLLVGTQRAAG